MDYRNTAPGLFRPLSEKLLTQLFAGGDLPLCNICRLPNIALPNITVHRMHTQFQLTRAFPSLWRGVVFLLCVCTGTLAQAQWKGATTRGTTGGLVIPSADVLPWSAMAISYGTYQEPQLGNFQIQQNASMGFGLLPYVELFGRLTNYETPVPGAILSNGIRDLSANVKVQIPLPWDGGPRLAGGFNDVTGGAVNFKSNYLVATDSYGPVDVTVGFAQGKSTGRALTFDGGFGGIAVRQADTGVSVLLEREGCHTALPQSNGPWRTRRFGRMLR